MLLRRKEIRPDPMTDGVHAVRITRAESKTFQSGNEGFRLMLEDLFTGEVARTNFVISEKNGFTVDAFFKSVNLFMPDDEFALDRRHLEGRTGFIRTETEETAEYGEQVRVRWISQKAAAKDDPRLADIAVSEAFTLPAIASGAVPQAKPRNVPRVQSSWPIDEAEKRRQAAEAEANKLHMNDDLDMSAPEPANSSVAT